MRGTLAAIAVLTAVIALFAQPPESAVTMTAPAVEDTIHSPSQSAPNPAAENTESVLSTDMGASDSLGLLPDAIETREAGGTRRISLERSVFRRQHVVEYNDNGRRDPFRALLTDKKNEGEVDTELLILEGALLTGVVWSDGQYLAMVKDKEGKLFFLREGDEIYGGHVLMVSTSQATFEIASFGSYQRTTLKVRG